MSPKQLLTLHDDQPNATNKADLAYAELEGQRITYPTKFKDLVQFRNDNRDSMFVLVQFFSDGTSISTIVHNAATFNQVNVPEADGETRQWLVVPKDRLASHLKQKGNDDATLRQFGVVP